MEVVEWDVGWIEVVETRRGYLPAYFARKGIN